MGEARKEILQMLQDGKVTADQAMQLMQAIEGPAAPADDESPDEEVLVGEVIRTAKAPNMDRFRRFWQVPFFLALGAMIGSGLILRSLYRSSEGGITLWFVCIWSVFIFTVLLTGLALLSRRAAWLHVRVQEKHGPRIAISFPLPIGMASYGVQFARNFVGDERRDLLDTAAAFLDAARDNLSAPDAEPMMINVDDDDGDRVEIFIG